MKFNSGYCLKYRLKTEDTSASRGLEILQGKRNVKDSRALSDRTTKTAKEVSLCVRVEDKVSNRNQTPFTLTVFKHGHQRSHQDGKTGHHRMRHQTSMCLQREKLLYRTDKYVLAPYKGHFIIKLA